MSDDLCEVCRDRIATWLHNPPRGHWRLICDQCEIIAQFDRGSTDAREVAAFWVAFDEFWSD